MAPITVTEPPSSDALEPVAIIGMGCRWPGDSETPSELWSYLQAKRSSYSKFPKDRINGDAFYHPDPNRPGSFKTEGGCFLEADVRQFDSSFFGIHPKEVLTMDPAQRKFLEVVYEAIESAGVPLDKLSGSKTGTFVGNFNYDHQLMHYRDPEYALPYSVTGSGITILSNRINYIFNLKGPSMTLDTACSSSLYALHLACSAIQTGDCDSAVVGGTNLILTPECQIFSSVLGAVSATSVCHTFDSRADGYARADGIGALYIKRLSQAVADGDPIRAVIRGTAFNANGRTGGSRIRARRAKKLASVERYFECHGTGTPVGDPIEVAAIGEVFAATRSASNPMLIGSIKSNMGHSEPSSGIAGVMKAVLAIEQGVIPPTVGIQTLNPDVDLKEGRLKIVTESVPWPDLDVRRASINSFGYGGSNAHVIVESVEALLPGYRSSHQASADRGGLETFARMNGNSTVQPPRDMTEQTSCNGHANSRRHQVAETTKLRTSHSKKQYLLPFSAHDERTLLANYDALLRSQGKWDLQDVAYTLSGRRSRFPQRSYVIKDVADGLPGFPEELPPPKKVPATATPTLGFVFTGQGAQWPRMGAALMAEYASCLATIRRLDKYLDDLDEGVGRDWSIEEVLQQGPEHSPVHQAELSQPLVTALQIMLVNLLSQWGITPGAAIGHSSGEIAASYATGILSEQEAITVAYLRGRAVSQNRSRGLMMAVGASLSRVQPLVDGYDGTIKVACHNSPESYTLSGDADNITDLKRRLDEDQIFCRLLQTGNNAYHSDHMKALGPKYESDLNVLMPRKSAARSLNKGASKIRPASQAVFFSSVYGHAAPWSMLDAKYWRQNLESPVLFHQGVAELVTRAPVDILVEIGPHAALHGPLRQLSQTMSESQGNGNSSSSSSIKFPEYLPTLTRGGDDVKNLLTLAGNLFTRGYNVDVSRLGKDVVFPSTGYIGMALEAASQIIEMQGRQVSEVECYDIRNVSLSKALIVPEDDFGIETLFTMRPASLNNVSRHQWLFDFVLTTVSTDGGVDTFTEHCRGQVEIGFEKYAFPESPTVAAIRTSPYRKRIVNAAQWYESFARVGLCYGPMFQGLSKISAVGQESCSQALVGLVPTAKAMSGESRYILHPASLDAAMQLSILAAHQNVATKFHRAFMPTAMESVKVWPNKVSQGTHAEAYAKATLKGLRGLAADVVLLGPDGQRVLEASNMFLTSSDQSAAKLIDESRPYTRMVWKPDFDYLTSGVLSRLYPEVVLESDAVIPSLNHLALHQLIHFQSTHAELFEKGTDQPHLQRLLDWTTEKLAEAVADPNSPAAQIAGYDGPHRAREIGRLSAALTPRSSEARLMCHLYDNLGAIYSGEASGIQVALQDNLLLENYETGQVYREGNRRLAAVMALLAHQNPAMRILEVGAGTGSATNEILPALRGEDTWRQYAEYRFTDTTPSFLASGEERFARCGGLTFGTFDMEQSGESQGYAQDWDAVVASNVIHATSDIHATLVHVRGLLRPGGRMVLLELTRSQLSAGLVLGTFSDFWKADHDPRYPRHDGPFLSKALWEAVLPAAGFSGLDFHLDDYAGANVSTTVLCATAVEPAIQVPRPLAAAAESRTCGIAVVYRHVDIPPPFAQPMADCIAEANGGAPVSIVPLAGLLETDITSSYDRFVFVLETAGSFFLDVTPEEWAIFQSILVRPASSSLWVTCGDLMDGTEPLHAMASGLARGIRTENMSLRFGLLDLDRVPNASDSAVFSLVGRLERQILSHGGRGLKEDSEFRYKNGVLHTSRLVNDATLVVEQSSGASTDQELATEKVLLRHLTTRPLQLAIEKASVLSTVYFKPDPAFSKTLPADEVEIEVRYAGVNNKDIAVLTGRHHSDSFSDECSGVVTQVGSEVEGLRPGDLVYCQSFARFGNYVRDKAAFCQRLEDGDTLEGTATLPVAFSTAIHGLLELGRLEKGETVLIQSATGAVGLAACQIARMVGAEILATVGVGAGAGAGEKNNKKAELLAMGFGIREDHVFPSRDRFTPQAILERTGGRGVDVILCSARGELMHEYWRTVASGGRFIEIGRTEVLDKGSLGLDVFRRNATFASFDLEVISTTKPQITARLMRTIQKLKAEGHIRPLPSTRFHAAEIDKAFMAFTKGTHIGKLLVSYDHDSDEGVTVQRDPFVAKFDPDATYLLVGCLGGLGRSFSTWAVLRGARHLLYLSRSGAVDGEARSFVEGLRGCGVEVSIVRGDVTSLPDVQRAVEAAGRRPIRGVVQGALSLHDGLFEAMSLEQFQATARPRVLGTLNLDRATRHCPLDFFELWSSWTVVFGTSTQSNYLASNAFLDAFARHRRARGRPCTSLALSQVLGVGIVSYMPEYQQAMVRNGYYGNDEGEFLRYCEQGILPPPGPAHVLDPAFRYDPQTLGHLLVGIEPAGLRNLGHQYPISDMPWYHDPRFQNLIQATALLSSAGHDQRGAAAAAAAAAAAGDEDSTALDRIVGKLSRLLYIPVDEVDVDQAISHYGIDSMVAAELRNWCLSAFGRQVSMLKLLSATMTVQKLAEEAEQKLTVE
ncbi:hypothetical protein PG996_013600 [Apiospora saccharicola]|uniref:Polyketide synthase n=1 Tax=Apiospora saccharicola TaxID=335842 RepID=A0ABR1U5Y5_9PEZI